MSNYKIAEEKVTTDAFLNMVSTYVEKGSVLYEIIEEKQRLSSEMIENYKVLFDEYKEDKSMTRSIDLLFKDEVFKANELTLTLAIVFDIVTTCNKILETEDIPKRVELTTKFSNLIASPRLDEYKKLFYGY